MYAYIHVLSFMHTCVYIYIYAHTLMYACMHVCIYVFMHACMRACVCSCMYVGMRVGIYTIMHACMHVCMYEYACMHHACMDVSACIDLRVFGCFICVHSMQLHLYRFECLCIYVHVFMPLTCQHMGSRCDKTMACMPHSSWIYPGMRFLRGGLQQKVQCGAVHHIRHWTLVLILCIAAPRSRVGHEGVICSIACGILAGLAHQPIMPQN